MSKPSNSYFLNSNTSTEILRYDSKRYPFQEILEELIGSEELALLRADLPGEEALSSNSLYKNMEQSAHFRRLYDNLDARGERFYTTYRQFVEEQIRPQFNEPIYYQARPSHRILFRDTPGVSRFHRDRDYGHSTHEINYWVVQTPAFANNTIWIESAEGLEDFQPYELQPGEYLRFHGADLMHGAQLNDTDRTRVSFDFRVIAESHMRQEDLSGGKFAAVENPVLSNSRKYQYCP